MSKFYYRHKATGTKIPEDVLRNTDPQKNVVVQNPIHKFESIETEYSVYEIDMYNYRYHVAAIPFSSDWELEYWDYSYKFDFNELNLLESIMLAEVVIRENLEANNTVCCKVKEMLKVEFQRVRKDKDYFERIKE